MFELLKKYRYKIYYLHTFILKERILKERVFTLLIWSKKSFFVLNG